MAKLKYWLLNLLLRDICAKSKCAECPCGDDWFGCAQWYVRKQARKVWGVSDVQ